MDRTVFLKHCAKLAEKEGDGRRAAFRRTVAREVIQTFGEGADDDLAWNDMGAVLHGILIPYKPVTASFPDSPLAVSWWDLDGKPYTWPACDAWGWGVSLSDLPVRVAAYGLPPPPRKCGACGLSTVDPDTCDECGTRFVADDPERA